MTVEVSHLYLNPRGRLAAARGEADMVKQSPHKRWKGHCLMCGEHSIKGTGLSHQRSGTELKRAFGGRKRRIKRNDIPRRDEW